MSNPIVSRETFSFTDEELKLIVQALDEKFMSDMVAWSLPKHELRPIAELHNALCEYVGAKPIIERLYLEPEPNVSRETSNEEGL